jgi:hypothetical protein
MNSIQIPSEEQIKEILRIYSVGKDSFKNRYLPLDAKAKDFRFEVVFTVTENDVYEYVKKFGWDKSTVSFLNHLPDPSSESIPWCHITLPKSNGRFPLAHFNSYDRNLWDEWDFATEEERDRFIIHQLFETQRGFWGKKHTPQEIGLVRPEGTPW